MCLDKFLSRLFVIDCLVKCLLRISSAFIHFVVSVRYDTVYGKQLHVLVIIFLAGIACICTRYIDARLLPRGFDVAHISLVLYFCISIRLLVISVNPAKTDEPTEMPFWGADLRGVKVTILVLKWRHLANMIKRSENVP